MQISCFVTTLITHLASYYRVCIVCKHYLQWCGNYHSWAGGAVLLGCALDPIRASPVCGGLGGAGIALHCQSRHQLGCTALPCNYSTAPLLPLRACHSLHVKLAHSWFHVRSDRWFFVQVVVKSGGWFLSQICSLLQFYKK